MPDRPQRPIRVLYCIDRLVRGGTELQLVELIRRLDRDRFEPALLTLRPFAAEEFDLDCRHLAWEVPRLFSPGGLRAGARLVRWLRDGRIDVVQTFFQDSTLFGGAAARLAGVPVRLASFRDMGFWRTPATERLLRFMYRRMTGYIANANVVREGFAAGFGIDPDRCEVVYNGVDIEALPWIDHAEPTTDIAIVGNLNRRVKRTDLFLRAAGLVARRHPEVTWHVLGDGELRGELEGLARQVGLGERVRFAGRVADVSRRLESCQAAVICSDSEGLSNALLEYLCKGCAAVATDVGGNPELVRHGQTGLLVPPDDPESLAEALFRLIEDVDLRRSLSQQARRFALENFSWERCLAEHARIYTRGLANSR